MTPPPSRTAFAEPRRDDQALILVRRAIAVAEEKYLVDPGASLGTWFARVQETVAIVCRVAHEHIDHHRAPFHGDFAAEYAGLFADVCAEAIRAAAQVRRAPSRLIAREELTELLGDEPARGALSWSTLPMRLIRLCATLEPLAAGLRQGDRAMAEPDIQVRLACLFFEVAGQAFETLRGLCR